jgi:hypothetical protein
MRQAEASRSASSQWCSTSHATRRRRGRRAARGRSHELDGPPVGIESDHPGAGASAPVEGRSAKNSPSQVALVPRSGVGLAAHGPRLSVSSPSTRRGVSADDAARSRGQRQERAGATKPVPPPRRTTTVPPEDIAGRARRTGAPVQPALCPRGAPSRPCDDRGAPAGSGGRGGHGIGSARAARSRGSGDRPSVLPRRPAGCAGGLAERRIWRVRGLKLRSAWLRSMPPHSRGGRRRGACRRSQAG